MVLRVIKTKLAKLKKGLVTLEIKFSLGQIFVIFQAQKKALLITVSKAPPPPPPGQLRY